MAPKDDEEARLRSVAFQTAESILLARRQAEEELARSLAMMRATLESTTDAILVTDGDRKITGYNEKLVEMWDLPRAVLDAKDHGRLAQLTSRQFSDPPRILARLDEIYATSPKESYDLLELADGRVFERFSRIQFVDERNVGRVWSFRDITERRRDEERLRESSAALKESDRRKDEFLALLGHELRNPLAPIRNAVQVLRVKNPPIPELQWATDMIDRQVHQMTRLIDDLLDVSRITRGTIQLRKQHAELAGIVGSTVEVCRPLFEKAGHEFTLSIPSEPIRLEVDVTRLGQVLFNLLDNAVKYTDPGGHVELSAQRTGTRVLIRVKDSGIGIPAEMLPRIFEMFTQVDRTLERSRGGLGAGLALVQWLVELHDGTVEAFSAGPGRGSEFVVSLPVRP